MITFDNQVLDSYFRWWVVHLWVEGVWELIMGAILSFLLIKLTGRGPRGHREVALRHRRPDLPLGHPRHRAPLLLHRRAQVLADGSAGSSRRWSPSPSWAWPLRVAMARRGGRQHPNRIALFWTVGCGIMSFVGAGFLGFAHTLPQVNIWTHGTLVTAMHGHLAFWGAYAMIVFAMISYALPQMTGRKLRAAGCRSGPSGPQQHRHGRR
jgi:nitric oxide reductase subunit B